MDPEKRIGDRERRAIGRKRGGRDERRDARADKKREWREEMKRRSDQAGISPARHRITRRVLWTLLMLAVLGIVAFIAGVVVGGSLVWMGLALFAGSFIPLVVVVEVRERKIAKSRWQVGTVTFRTVEPGRVDEYGQEVVCEVTVNPTAPITRVAATIGPLDTQWLVVGATIRCLADPRPAVLPRAVLRAFPYAGDDATLPSGREVKFSKAIRPR